MNPVLYWNTVLLEASRRDFTRGFTSGQQPGPIRTAYAMAIVHLAIHDAVALRRRPAAAYLNKKLVAHGILTPLTGQVDDIIAGAAVTTLKALYPKFSSQFDDAIEAVNQVAFDQGVAVGNAILAHRQGDGSDTMITGPQPTNPAYGEHRADPYAAGQSQLGPAWGNVTRFIGGSHQSVDDYPRKGVFLSDPYYKADYEEVRDLGAAGVARVHRTSSVSVSTGDTMGRIILVSRPGSTTKWHERLF
jgi:hypothetical protein